jgi:hypothetical protein
LSTTLDTRALVQTLPQLTLDSTTSFQAGAPRTFDLAEGDHTLSSYYGWGGSVSFHVDGSGGVTWDPLLNGVLSGSGTAASPLVVHGRTVTIDARALSMPSLILDSQVDFTNATSLTATVLPGNQFVESYYGYGGVAYFSVGNDGTVDYSNDPSLAGLLSGRGSTTLGVNGRTVTIDARALSMPSLILDSQIDFTNATSLTATVLPGNQFVESYYGYGGVAYFSVGNDGMVDYDHTLDGVLSGRGSTTLGVNGRTVTIDARALSMPSLVLDSQVDFTNATSLSATVLPGSQFVGNYYGWGGTAYFSVGNDGTVNYDRLLDLSGTLSGRGSSTLVVAGDTVQIDARALVPTTPSFTLAGIGTYPTGTVLGLTLLPGWERVSTPTETFDFHIDEFSRIDYDPINEGLASGRDTSTLVLLAPRMGPGGASPGEQGSPPRPKAAEAPAGGAAAEPAPAVGDQVDAVWARGTFGPKRVPAADWSDPVSDGWDANAGS